MAGECTPHCSEGEFPCPADRTCKQGFCIRNPCINKSCPAGTYCDANGDCIDRCTSALCLPGQTCEGGVCFDCFTRGCAAGQICRDRACVADPCAAVTCNEGSFCRAGQCIKSCSGVTCLTGQSCREGVCAPDPCATKICSYNEFCDPATVTCKPRPCLVTACVAGQACVETTGRCTADPCIGVRCGVGDLCYVTIDGRAECRADANAPPKRTIEIGTSGGGLSSCACRVGAPTDRGGFAGAWLAGALGIAAVGRSLRRRRRQRPGSRDGGRR
jgi:hypothetical protein